MDLTEADDIKKRWQELYKKDLNHLAKHDCVITHLEPGIRNCEVRLSLGSITMNKTSGGNGISAELYEILKDDAVKVLQSICQQIRKTRQWPQDWKRLVFIPIPKKRKCKSISQSCLSFCNPIDYIVHGIFQARILEWGAFPFFFPIWDQTQVSRIASGFFTS